MSSNTQVDASVLHGAKDLRIEQRTLPPPSESEVQIAVSATGLCGSDLHYYNHFRNGNIIVKEPLTLGHESAGVVTAVGSSVTNLQPGDRVALEVGLPCEACEFCLQGRYNICKAMSFRSSAKSVPHAQGTLQTRINHPARWAHKLPEALSLEHGALIEPLSVAMHARTVVIADILPERTEFAVRNGFADARFTVPMARPQTIEEKLVYAQDVAEKIKGVEVGSTKPGGKVMIIGMGTPIQTIPISAASLKEVDLVGVFRYANTYPAAIELLGSKDERLPDVGKLVTQRFRGLSKIPAAFDMAGKVKDEQGNLVLKVMVNTSDGEASS
ncbi:hypothetical protein CIB48_g9723 [Xylaria polymorpha]|nr:hypothetical protein CIB48_g9723 [Xylaria polymorpha]